MKRLTNKNQILEGYIGANVIKKLSDLEDIEEELGIDLITLFKALKQGYIETRGYKATDIVLAYNEYIKKWCFYEIDEGGYGNSWFLKDYGKTWALTKEELE